MINSLLQLDRKVFILINGHWHNAVLDLLLPFSRNPYTWAPLYLFLLLFMVVNFKWKGVIWILFFIATFAIADFITAHFLKQITTRWRPCNDPYFSQFVRSLAPCRGQHSFPSNHAANHFALGIFMFLTLKEKFGRWMWLALLWAFIVSYAQIYVGQHYPVDILVGTIAGLIYGTITGTIYNRKFQLTAP